MEPNRAGKKPRGNPRIVDAGVATRFKPGQSGNPGGRPRRTPYADAHRHVAELTVVEVMHFDRNFGDPVPIAIAKAVARQAILGNIGAAREAANRTEGKPQEFDEPPVAKLTLEKTLHNIKDH